MELVVFIVELVVEFVVFIVELVVEWVGGLVVVHPQRRRRVVRVRDPYNT